MLDRLDNFINLLVYALGYGIGISAGIKIEDYLALGYIMVNVILPSSSEEMQQLPSYLREKGYGVTQQVGRGLDGERIVLGILASRKREKELYREIKQLDDTIFIVSYEPKYISGGFWTKKVRSN